MAGPWHLCVRFGRVCLSVCDGAALGARGLSAATAERDRSEGTAKLAETAEPAETEAGYSAKVESADSAATEATAETAGPGLRAESSLPKAEAVAQPQTVEPGVSGGHWS